MYRIVLLSVLIASMISVNNGTPLDDYVNQPDPVFSWKLIQTHPSSKYTLHILNMTSQQWFNGIMIINQNKIFQRKTLFFSFIFITINLVALYGYYSA
jgi:hypothetical protein